MYKAGFKPRVKQPVPTTEAAPVPEDTTKAVFGPGATMEAGTESTLPETTCGVLPGFP